PRCSRLVEGTAAAVEDAAVVAPRRALRATIRANALERARGVVDVDLGPAAVDLRLSEVLARPLDVAKEPPVAIDPVLGRAGTEAPVPAGWAEARHRARRRLPPAPDRGPRPHRPRRVDADQPHVAAPATDRDEDRVAVDVANPLRARRLPRRPGRLAVPD